MKLNLNGKVALVTGGARGIGVAICKALAEEGVKVGVNYRKSKDAAEALVAEINSDQYPGAAISIQGNIGAQDDVIPMFDALEKEYGQVDILVNNAAYCPKGPIGAYTKEEWEFTFAVNVTGVFLATQHFVKQLRDKGIKGNVVNLASQAAFLGSTSGHLPYDSSKGALISMTRAVARETAPDGIRVNAIAPGMVMTEMVAELWEQKKDFYLSRIPMGRIAEPEEIANMVVFLASDASSFMTGTTLDATGGLMMR
ncbi:MAG: 3-oxoacyl-ACP reductase family protein [Kiritimatiellia bacterium]|jgi:3-oxoacyl-[acyl-carrier protein] reductase|nr:3-oxoacyl-ACP reductase family protein [Kiritimatiellia bacterium]